MSIENCGTQASVSLKSPTDERTYIYEARQQPIKPVNQPIDQSIAQNESKPPTHSPALRLSTALPNRSIHAGPCFRKEASSSHAGTTPTRAIYTRQATRSTTVFDRSFVRPKPFYSFASNGTPILKFGLYWLGRPI